MEERKNYRTVIKENEAVFRNILADMKDNRQDRPAGRFIPADLSTEGTIDTLLERYSNGNRENKFTICDFVRPTKGSAMIKFKNKFKNMTAESSGEAELEYLVKPDNSVEYKWHGMVSVATFSPEPHIFYD